MNWKVNYWTVLFALTIIGWLVSNIFVGEEANTGSGFNEIVVEDSPYELKPAVAKKRIREYKNFYKEVDLIAKQDTFLLDGATAVGANPLKGLVKRLDMEKPAAQFFQLPIGELSQMLDKFKENAEVVYAELSLEKDITTQGKGRKVIDLVFSVKPAFTDAGKAATEEVYYFDFTTPCPPTCKPPPPSTE